MVRQLIRVRGRSVLLDIGWRRAGKKALRRQLTRHQTGVAQRADADYHIGSLLHRVDKGIAQGQLDIQKRVLRLQCCQQRSDMPSTKGHRRIDA